MIGLFLITHGSCGEALIQCACHVLHQRPPRLAQFGMTPQDDPQGSLPLARQIIAGIDGGEGVLILTDIYGASPANLALKLLDPPRIAGLAGVNLPMLLRALTYRDKDMATLLAKAASGGRDGVIDMQGN